MRKRINVTLPEETVRLIDSVAEKGDRSALIDEAVRDYVSQRGRTRLRKLLKEGAIQRASRDLAITGEWVVAEHEVWQRKRKR